LFHNEHADETRKPEPVQPRIEPKGEFFRTKWISVSQSVARAAWPATAAGAARQQIEQRVTKPNPREARGEGDAPVQFADALKCDLLYVVPRTAFIGVAVSSVGDVAARFFNRLLGAFRFMSRKQIRGLSDTSFVVAC